MIKSKVVGTLIFILLGAGTAWAQSSSVVGAMSDIESQAESAPDNSTTLDQLIEESTTHTRNPDTRNMSSFKTAIEERNDVVDKRAGEYQDYLKTNGVANTELPQIGAGAGEVLSTMAAMDMTILGRNFSMCNEGVSSNNLFTLALPKIEVASGAVGIGFVNACYHFYLNPPMNGLCIKIESKIWPCTIDITVTSLKEYAFPTADLSTSTIPLVSKLIPDFVGKLWNSFAYPMLTGQAFSYANSNAIQAMQIASNTLTKLGVESPSKQEGSEKEAGNPEMTALAQQKAAEGAAYAKAYREQKVYGSSDAPPGADTNSEMYFRSMFDLLNVMTNYIDYIPHKGLYNFYGSDLQGFLHTKSASAASAGALLNLAGMGSSSSGKGGSGGGSLSQSGSLACSIANNKLARGPRKMPRMPIDVLLSVGAAATGTETCIADIGAKVPHLSTFLGSVTDRSFRALFSGLTLLEKNPLGLESHPYKEKEGNKEIDRIYFPKNDESLLDEESKEQEMNCKTYPQLKSVDYDKSNMRVLGGANENLMHQYNVYKGCWGYKEKDEDYWTTIIDIGSLQEKLRFK